MKRADLLEQGRRRREAIVDFIRDFVATHDYPPTVQQITDGVELSSASATRHHLQALADAGRLSWTRGGHRSLRLLDADQQLEDVS